MDDLFGPLPKASAVQQDAPAADLALETDVGADAHDPPFIATTGMRLAQPHEIVYLNVLRH
jgi:hypothetical protein